MENNALARLANSIVPAGKSAVDDFLRQSETVMLLIDCSGSMEAYVRATGKRRIDALREIVRDLKQQGSVPMIAFGGPYDAQVRFVDNVPEPDGGTPLAQAIVYAKTYGATRLVVVSDGMPEMPDQCMTEAKRFGGQIDVVFVGDPGEQGSFFLDELAKATGGKRFEGDLGDTKKLSGTVIGLLEGAVEPPRAPIQGPGFVSEEGDPEEVGTDDGDDDDFEDEEEEDDDDEDA